MARYIQRISLLGKERWIGWELDGVGTEIPGLAMADELTADELQARGVREFHTLTFETFVGMGALAAGPPESLLDEDVAFRLDALQVAIERQRSRGEADVPRAFLVAMLGGESLVDDARVQARFRLWQDAGQVRIVGTDDCYLRVTGRFV
jgi:hypothetical protein